MAQVYTLDRNVTHDGVAYLKGAEIKDKDLIKALKKFLVGGSALEEVEVVDEEIEARKLFLEENDVDASRWGDKRIIKESDKLGFGEEEDEVDEEIEAE